MFKTVDVIAELTREREIAARGAEPLLDQITGLFSTDAAQEENIRQRLSGKESNKHVLTMEQLGALDGDLIFSQEVIQKICTKYRLRFLNSTLFAGDIPVEAMFKIKDLERNINHTFTTFSVLAPESRFKLKDSTEDPILFADLGNGEYYMIHKWGNDMGWYRNLLNFPARNITTLALSSVIAGLLTVLLLPGSLFPEVMWESSYTSILGKVYLSFIVSGLFFVSALIIGILRSKEFSEDIWNSKYFN